MVGPALQLTPGVPAQITCAFLVVFAIDLGNYVSHWLMHHVGFLWEFHKTHHSAEVLNPLTADRLHPLERLLIELWVAVALGLTIGALRYLYSPHLSLARVFGINVFALITNVISGNLRHSHVWISYGAVLEHIFSSPAQHQIHHSRHPDHLDKNLATHFARWDWLFGTLYLPPARPQSLDLGLADGSERLYRNPWALFARPFQANWARLRAALAR
jgi:sterol desaturase/sphingolipid hydroxylase (fatty acid hydroxylase superfamily)